MSKWNLVVDIDKCNNCNNCTMAMKDEYVGNDFPGYSAPQPKQGHEWITIDRHVRGNGTMVDVNYVPRTCNHCDNAPCVAAGKGAVVKRPDGIVMIDPRQAKGRRDLVGACPYGMIWWNEELQLPQQWTFDAHLMDAGWKDPRCVQACATGALTAVKATDEAMDAMVKSEGLSVLRPELKTRPRVFYLGLERAHSFFLGGNVCARLKDDRLDNVEGATVELVLGNGRDTRRIQTDAFGDFKFDGLDARETTYVLRAQHRDHGGAEVRGTLSTSRYLGPIQLA